MMMQPDLEVQIVEMPEINMIGFAVTSPFIGHRPERVVEMIQQFRTRRNEIQNQIHAERYVCPSFSSDVLFTYLIGMEVSDLPEVPEGMIGFTIPPGRYAKGKSADDPYRVIHDYLAANGLKSNKRKLALECYTFENSIWPAVTI